MNNWIIALIKTCYEAGMNRVEICIFLRRILGNYFPLKGGHAFVTSVLEDKVTYIGTYVLALVTICNGGNRYFV